MFIPYRVIQIKTNKNKHKSPKPKSKTLKYCDPLPKTLNQAIKTKPLQTIQQCDHAHKNSYTHRTLHQSITQRSKTTSVLKKRDRGNYSAMKSGQMDSLTKNQEYRYHKKQSDHKTMPNAKLRISNDSKGKKNEKQDEKVQKYYCFNFSVCLDEKQKCTPNKMKQIVKNRKYKQQNKQENPQQYRHESLGVVSHFYNTINCQKQKKEKEQKRPLSGRNQRMELKKQKMRGRNSFDTYLSEIYKLKNARRKTKVKKIEQQPIQVESKLMVEKQLDGLSKQKLTFLQQIYDRWKNSYKLHIKGKTIRKWDKKSSPQPKGNEQFGNFHKSVQKKKKGTRRVPLEDENKIEAWRESDAVKEENERFLEYNPSFTLGEDQYLYT